MGTHQSNRGISLAQILSVGFRPLPQTPPKWLEQAGAPLCPIEEHGVMEHEPLDDDDPEPED